MTDLESPTTKGYRIAGESVTDAVGKEVSRLFAERDRLLNRLATVRLEIEQQLVRDAFAPGWLQRVAKSLEADTAHWPKWRKAAVGVEPPPPSEREGPIAAYQRGWDEAMAESGKLRAAVSDIAERMAYKFWNERTLPGDGLAFAKELRAALGSVPPLPADPQT